MKRVLIAAMALTIALAACASNKKVYSSNGTTVTTDTSRNTVTVQSSEGTMRMGKDVVDAASLGVPVYTGATQDEGGLSMTGAKGSAQMASFTTTDPFEKVYAFYKSKMPAGSEKMKLDEGDSSVAEFVTGSGKAGEMQTMVMISKKGDKTAIVVTKGNQQ